jgi:hypothetical protein
MIKQLAMLTCRGCGKEFVRKSTSTARREWSLHLNNCRAYQRGKAQQKAMVIADAKQARYGKVMAKLAETFDTHEAESIYQALEIFTESEVQ